MAYVTELIAGFPNHCFSSLNNQNCDQGIVLKQNHPFFLNFDLDSRIEGVSGQTLKHRFKQFTIGAPLGFGFGLETHGNVLLQKRMGVIFFLVALDCKKSEIWSKCIQGETCNTGLTCL